MSLNSKLAIKFLGAARTVTGSKYLVSFGDKRVLVDCGLFQGLKDLRLKNWETFSIDARSIDAIVLTHAHIDHSGYIPRLIKEGFRGKIFCTPGTLALCRILLPDTGYLMEEEAEYLNRKKISKHKPALPLFTRKEAEQSLKQFSPHNFHEDFEVVPGLRVRFLNAGHILGAAMVYMKAGSKTIAFSGDLGRLNDPVMKEPESLPPFDYLVVESTYGDRLHSPIDPVKDLEQIILKTTERRGVILIPVFAVGRTQSLLHFLSILTKENRIPKIPMFLNSPMAASVTDVFCQFKSLHKLSERECNQLQDVVHYVKSVEESKMLNSRKGPMLIVSASGMATGGRILHHLKEFAPDPKNTIVLTGFQAAGTRGRALQDGAKEIKIHGQLIPVRAEVQMIDNLSAHADYSETLKWLSGSPAKPRKVFVTHGELNAAKALGNRIHEQFGWEYDVPEQEAEYALE